jgi:hypothetical protein
LELYRIDGDSLGSHLQRQTQSRNSEYFRKGATGKRQQTQCIERILGNNAGKNLTLELQF